MTLPLDSRNIGGAMFVEDCIMASTLLAGAAAVFLACTATTMRLAVHAGALWAATSMSGKFGSEFET